MGFLLVSAGFLYAEHECRRGHDIKVVLEVGEHLLLEYLSPGLVEFTLFLPSLLIPRERFDGQTFRLQLARRTLQRSFKKTSPRDISSYKYNKYHQFHRYIIIRRFITTNSLLLLSFWQCAVE